MTVRHANDTERKKPTSPAGFGTGTYAGRVPDVSVWRKRRQ